MANPEHMAILKQGVEVWNKWRGDNPHIKPELDELFLREANLSGMLLHKSNLQRSSLPSVILIGADLSKSNLSETSLIFADLSKANLYDANLSRANVTSAIFWDTLLSRVDLREVVGLEDARHLGPSSIGIDTLLKSKGDIPESFLRGAGVPDSFISYIGSLIGQAIEYYSAFISYSSRNQAFARRLHADLQDNGVRCWFAPEDLKIGARIRVGIDEAIRIHDKLLLVLSEHSVTSDWVEHEVETALERERQQGETVLFPIRVDEAVMDEKAGWAAHIKRTRNIGDFTGWKDHDDYQKAFDRLLRDLKAEE